MKKSTLRLFFGAVALASALFFSGCAEFAEGLSSVANEMQRQNQQNGYGDGTYTHTPRNTSAPGIK